MEILDSFPEEKPPSQSTHISDFIFYLAIIVLVLVILTFLFFISFFIFISWDAGATLAS